MTVQEALEHFIRRKESYDGIADKIQDAENVAIIALRKQTPQKPHKIFNSATLHCPVCEYEVGYDNDFTSKRRYCPDCGQAIDWSEND